MKKWINNLLMEKLIYLSFCYIHGIQEKQCPNIMPPLDATFMKEGELVKMENGIAFSCNAFYWLDIVPLLSLISTTMGVRFLCPHFSDKKTEALWD